MVMVQLQLFILRKIYETEIGETDFYTWGKFSSICAAGMLQPIYTFQVAQFHEKLQVLHYQQTLLYYP